MNTKKLAKPYCRSCRAFLGSYGLDKLHVFICPKCDSKLIRLMELDKVVKKRTIDELRELSRRSKSPSSIDCGHCGKSMNRVQLSGSTVQLDCCRTCEALWFGGAEQEYEKFLLEEMSLKPETKEMLSRDRLGALQKETQIVHHNYSRWVQPLMVSHEHDRLEDIRFRPQVSGYLFFLILLLSFVAFKRHDVLMSMIHSNKEALLRQLITTVTHFFIHADWFHLLGNLLFFGIFAHGVEKKIGPVALLKLIGLSLISYTVFQIFWYGQQQVYSLGASVGIAACMAYYITGDPYRPFRLTIPRYGRAFSRRPFYVLVVPVWIFLLLYILKEVMSLKAQMAGRSNIAHTGHLVGIFVGLFFYTIYPPPQKHPSS